MKNIAVISLVGLIVIIFGLFLFLFQVREIESALVTSFAGEPREITEPGWYFRWPAPIQRVYKFDSRMRVLEVETNEIPTRGTSPIIVNAYVVWKIAKPLEFFKSVGTVKEATSKLRFRLSDTQTRVIGQHYFSEFVNSDASKIKFAEIEQEMLADMQKNVGYDYGVEIKALGIKQLKISEDVTKDVFDRMRAERERRTKLMVTEGEVQAMSIRGDANAKRTILLAAAEARAKAIMGQGDAEAAKHLKSLEADPELAMFLRNVEALEKILKKRSTIVLSPDAEPFTLLKRAPTSELKK